MSSNLELKRICQHCGKSFIARKMTTKFCSLECGQRNYKVRERINKITASNIAAKASFNNLEAIQAYAVPSVEKYFINIELLSLNTSISERTLFRLLKDHKLPRLKIGRKLLFHRETVINYLTNKYGIYFF
ncbi:MAG: helix-turn-helix domain-containing protein [Bacteroidetes bacterium]|nr:helix-turn-helix domain-containing protein [Bacteroidota bacterium]